MVHAALESVAHPFELLRLDEVRSQAVELDVERDTTPGDDLTHTAAHGRAPADHPDSRTRGEGGHQTDVSLTVAAVTRTRES
jgi:hypothetical protein